MSFVPPRLAILKSSDDYYFMRVLNQYSHFQVQLLYKRECMDDFLHLNSTLTWPKVSTLSTDKSNVSTQFSVLLTLSYVLSRVFSDSLLICPSCK